MLGVTFAMTNVIILLGCAGAGKGTQGRLLSDRLSIPKISTGDMLRNQVARGTALGDLIAARMRSGGLVNDEIVNQAVKERISDPDCAGGFIVDGYPRTIQQAEFLHAELSGRHEVIALDIHVNCSELLRRLPDRRSCVACGSIFNLATAPPLVEGTCDHCGTVLVQREDDRAEVIRERFRQYMEQGRVLAAFYGLRAAYHRVTGGGSVDDVAQQIECVLARIPSPATVRVAVG